MESPSAVSFTFFLISYCCYDVAARERAKILWSKKKKRIIFRTLRGKKDASLGSRKKGQVMQSSTAGRKAQCEIKKYIYHVLMATFISAYRLFAEVKKAKVTAQTINPIGTGTTLILPVVATSCSIDQAVLTHTRRRCLFLLWGLSTNRVERRASQWVSVTQNSACAIWTSSDFCIFASSPRHDPRSVAKPVGI